jgi:hypothetical protein
VTAQTTRTGTRRAYLDRLKIVLIAAIIFGHGVFGYSGYGGTWPYQPVREVRLAAITDVLFGVVVLPATLFAMGLFFLIAGLLTPASLDRKGTRRFVADRALRLGVPLIVWVLVLWPALMYGLHRATGDREPFRHLVVHWRPVLDTGPMWFVEILLGYSVAYAWWRHFRRARPDEVPRPVPLTGRTLVALAAAVAAGTVLVRLAFPFESPEPAHLNLWQWPQYLALFGLGLVGARLGWFDPVPDRLRRASGRAALAGVLASLGLVAAGEALHVDRTAFTGGWGWPPVSLAIVEGVLAVAAPVWLLGIAQRADRGPGRLGTALARAAYPAFIVQAPVLIGLALALRPVHLPAEVKALVVGCLGVAGSYALAWLWSVSRIR